MIVPIPVQKVFAAMRNVKLVIEKRLHNQRSIAFIMMHLVQLLPVVDTVRQMPPSCRPDFRGFVVCHHRYLMHAERRSEPFVGVIRPAAAWPSLLKRVAELPVTTVGRQPRHG